VELCVRRQRQKKQIHDLFGFDFPEDLYDFWDFANRLRPLEPLNALLDPLHVQLVGPFDVLAGRFDPGTARDRVYLHWRYWNDPPEFFTSLVGDTDGLHWGHYLDDPRQPEGCVASYYASDAFELSADGDTLFEAVRLHLEELTRDCLDSQETDSENAARYAVRLEELDRLREELKRVATTRRSETGEGYVEKYQARKSSRARRITAPTQDGLCIVVPDGTYRPLSLRDRSLWRRLWDQDDPGELVKEARQALAEGFPGTALKLGKDLWAIPGEKRAAYAAELLDAAYAALGRDVLRQVLAAHLRERDRPWLDSLHEDDSGETES
jgi:hypothetical protein